MDFQEFEKRIVKIKNMDLPGEEAQFQMAPLTRLSELKSAAKTMNNAREAGVMALFYPSLDRTTRMVLILRKTYRGVHSAQVGFPGGKLEKDDDSLKDAALRETEEEVGVPREKIKIVRELTEVYIPPSNFFVKPFVGIASQTPTFIPEEKEVEAIIEVELEKFLDEKSLRREIISASYAAELEVPAFVLNDHIVWGATAMILFELREMLNKIF